MRTPRGTLQPTDEICKPESSVRENQITRKIIGCNAMHFFVHEPNSKTVLRREYLCDCQSCLNLDFGSCEESEQKENPANTPEVEVV